MANAPFTSQPFSPSGQPTQEFYQYLQALDRAVRSLSPTTPLKPLPPAQFAIVQPGRNS